MAARRPKKMINGILHLQCKCPQHKGAWVPREDFPNNKGGYARTVCKKYWRYFTTTKKYPNELDLHGFVPVERVRFYTREIIRLCGGLRPASRVTGITETNLILYSGRGSQRNPIYKVRARTAARILALYVLIRNGELKDEARSR